MKRFVDDFGNYATLEHDKRPAYQGGKKQDNFRLSLYALYDNNYLYHVSCYDTEAEALAKLSCFSCGSFREVVKTA